VLPPGVTGGRVQIKDMPKEVGGSEQQFEYLQQAESVQVDEQELQDLVEEKLSPQDFRKKLREK
jgi:hypothetical protein